MSAAISPRSTGSSSGTWARVSPMSRQQRATTYQARPSPRSTRVPAMWGWSAAPTTSRFPIGPRGRPGPLLRYERRRMERGRLHNSSGPRYRIQPLCRPNHQRLLLWKHLLRHVPGPADLLAAGLREHHAFADGTLARDLHQHLVVETVHGRCDGVRGLPAVGGRLSVKPVGLRRIPALELEQLQHLAVQQHGPICR